MKSHMRLYMHNAGVASRATTPRSTQPSSKPAVAVQPAHQQHMSSGHPHQHAGSAGGTCAVAVGCRVNPSALCIFIGLWHLVVYCPMAHMVWHPTGVIRVWGVLDFAGRAPTTTPLARTDRQSDCVHRHSQPGLPSMCPVVSASDPGFFSC